MRSLIEIYALAVCFVTLLCFVVALGIGLYDVVQFTMPKFTMAYHEPYRSNDAFRQYYPDAKDQPDHEVTRRREQMLDSALDAERRAAMQSAVFVAIILVIDIVVFAVHWKIASKERQVTRPVREP